MEIGCVQLLLCWALKGKSEDIYEREEDEPLANDSKHMTSKKKKKKKTTAGRKFQTVIKKEKKKTERNRNARALSHDCVSLFYYSIL